MDEDLKRREEAKRNAHWSAAQRLRIIQETISWANAQAPVPRNSKARCLELQRKKKKKKKKKKSSSPLWRAVGDLDQVVEPGLNRTVDFSDLAGKNDRVELRYHFAGRIRPTHPPARPTDTASVAGPSRQSWPPRQSPP